MLTVGLRDTPEADHVNPLITGEVIVNPEVMLEVTGVEILVTVGEIELQELQVITLLSHLDKKMS